MKTVYFILGVHRSGTSALAGVLNILGLELGSDLMPATEMNPKGYFENMLVYKMNEKILNENNSSWSSCHFNVDNIPKEKRKSYKEEIKKIIDDEFRYAEKFAIKDPRVCLLFPIWESACINLGIEIKIILPYRNPIEVAHSLKKRNTFSFGKSLILWSHHFLSAEYFSREYERMFLSFNKLLNDTEKTVDKLCDFIQLQPKKRKPIADFLDKKIKHSNITIENFTNDTPVFLQKLILLLKESNFNINVIDKIRNDFYFSLEMFQHTEILESTINEKAQSTEINILNKKIELLEKIKDIAKPDKSYYKQKYSDLQRYDGDMSEHYYKHGKEEGRIPNQYCEYFNIDTKEMTSNCETIYLQKNQLKQKDQELCDKNNTIQKLQEQKNKLEQDQQAKLQEKDVLNQKADKVLELLEALKKQKQQIEELLKAKHNNNKELNTINQEREKQLKEKAINLEEKNKIIQKLRTQKDKLVQAQQENLQELTTLNQNIKQVLDSIRSNNSELSTKNKKQKNQLKKKKKNIKELQAQIETLKKQKKQSEESLNTERNNISELNIKNQQQQNQLKRKVQELENKKQKIIQIQEKHTALCTQQKLRIKEIEELNTQIDEIIEDLIGIKESKCWIYTKPIRNLQKIFKD